MLKWFCSLFRRKSPLSVYPPRRRGVLSFIDVPNDEEDRPSGMGRGMPGRESSESVDYSGVNLGGEFRGRSWRENEDEKIGEAVRRISESFESDDRGEPDEMANPY